MFQIKFSTLLGSPSNVIDDTVTIHPGLSVMVNTLCYGQQVGTIKSIGLSPFYPECNEGVQRAYIEGDGWSDYQLIEELDVLDFEEALEYDPNYVAFVLASD